jgi:hypothetical protein
MFTPVLDKHSVFVCPNMSFNGDLAAGRCDLRLGKHDYHNHKAAWLLRRIGGRVVVTCDLGSMITTIIRRQNSPGFGIVHSANSSVAKETAPPGAVLRT